MILPLSENLQPVATAEMPLEEAQGFHRACHAQIERLAEAVRSGERKRIRSQLRQTLASRKCSISQLLKVGYRPNDRTSLESAARTMNCSAIIDGKIPWYLEPKSSGGNRVIVSLPPLQKARHKLLKLALEAQFDPSQSVYNVSKRGRDALVQDLVSFMNKDFSHVIRCDVRDCYPNFNPEALHELPLPRKEIDNYLRPDNLRFVQRVATGDTPVFPLESSIGASRDNTGNTTRPSGPRGLMQGSPVANAILAYFFQDLPNPGCNAKMLIFADDFFVVGKDMRACRVAVHTLTRHLAQCRYGPLELVVKEDSEAGYFEGLGYGFTLCPYAGRWIVQPSTRNYDKLDSLHEDALISDHATGHVLPFYGNRAIVSRLHSFRSISERKQILEMYHERGKDSLQLVVHEYSRQLRAHGFDEDAVDKALVAMVNARAMSVKAARTRHNL